MKVGFYRGITALDAGGIAPYADRVISVLREYTFQGIDLKILPLASNRLLRKITSHLHDSFYLLTHPYYPHRRRPFRASTTLLGADFRGDLIHFPYQVPGRVRFRCPFIVTMHDIQELHFPEFFNPQERLRRADYYFGAIEQSARIVVSFEHVKEDLVRYFRIPEDKVAVIPVPYNACRFKELDRNSNQDIENRLRALCPYFLYPAQTWEHKNHLALIEAFERFCGESEQEIHLVCTGTQNEYFERVLKRRVDQSLQRRRIHFLGVVSEEELGWLYRHAAGVVLPTLYEAGSFPLIEAMQMGTPVICANTTSLPETIGDEAFVFDPRSRDSLIQKMRALLLDESYIARNRMNSKVRIEALQRIAIGPYYEELWHTTIARERSKND